MLGLYLLVGGALFTAHQAYQSLQKNRNLPCLATKQPETQCVLPAVIAADSASVARSNQEMLIAGTALGLASAGALISPALSLAALPPILYLSLPTLRTAYQSVVQEQRIGAAVPQSFAIVVCLLNGYYVAPALGLILASMGRKLLTDARQQTPSNLCQLLADLRDDVSPTEQGVVSKQRQTYSLPDTQVIVEAGNLIPVDGVIVAGFALVSQKWLTGDAHPLAKQVGDPVFAASLLLTGRIIIQTKKVEGETIAGQIAQIRQHTAQHAFESSRLAQEQMAPLTLSLGALTAVLSAPIAAAAILYNSLGYESENVAPVLQSSFLALAVKYGVLMRRDCAIAQLSQTDTLVFSPATLCQPNLVATLNGLRQRHHGEIYLFTSTPPSQAQLELDPAYLLSFSSSAEQSAQIKRWQNAGKRVCIIGDGIVDRELIEQAEIAISLHGFADLAENPAAILLLDGSLQRLPYLFQLAQEFAAEQERMLKLNYVAGLCGLAAVLFFNAGLVTILLFNSAGVAVSLTSALLPSADYEAGSLRKRLVALLRRLPTPVPAQTPISQASEPLTLRSLAPVMIYQ